MTNEFASLSAVELLNGYRSKAFSPVEVVSASLERAERLNPDLNAFYIIDSEGALDAARASEARWSKGAPCGPLDGVPSSVKDALASKGMPSFRGSAAHRADEQSWDVDTPSVARMREAGAVFLGKTTMPDFGILPSGLSSKHGVTRNPWDLSKTPGGSTAGGTAAVAAGIHPIVIGTDIVGSIRLPASFGGLVGHKPSYGRVPFYFPNSPSVVAGPMARTVEDMALLMGVLALPDKRDFTSLPYDYVDYTLASNRGANSNWKIGYIEDLGFGLTPDFAVVGLMRDAVKSLTADGFDVRPVSSKFSSDDLRVAERFYKVRCRAEFNTMPSDRQHDASVIDKWSEEAETLSALEFYGLFSELQKMRERAMQLSEGVDFLILPTVHIPAFDAEKSGPDTQYPFEPFAYSFLFNLTEQPASSVPCGMTPSGLPVGLQIVGKRYDDAGVFRMSAHLEKSLWASAHSKSVICRFNTRDHE